LHCEISLASSIYEYTPYPRDARVDLRRPRCDAVRRDLVEVPRPLRAGFLVAVFLFGERRFVAAAARFFGDRLLVAADAGFAPLVRFFAAPIAAPVTAPSTVPTIGAPRAVPATAPATAPPSVLFVVPETASLSPSSLSLSSISISVLQVIEKPGRGASTIRGFA
jgi:hypothetical protein